MHRRAARTLVAAFAATLLVPATAGAYTVSAATVTEGGDLEFKVSKDPLEPANVTAQPVSDTATAGSDFDGAAKPIVIVGETTVRVATVGDDVDEGGAETMKLRVEGVEGVGTITDDDPTPALSIGDTSVSEDAGSATLTITASNPSGRDLAIGLSAADGTAKAFADFPPPSSVTLPAGRKTVDVTVPITNDFEDEADETFSILVGAPDGATVADGEGVVTIVNDDLRTVEVADAGTPEGTSGTSAMRFVVRLNAPTFRPVTVRYVTADGVAKGGTDYLGRLGVAVIPAGALSTTIDIAVVGDAEKEPAEAFALFLTGAENGRIVDSLAVGVIEDDDAAVAALGDDEKPPRMTLGAPRGSGRRVTVKIACPRGESSCKGRVTLFGKARGEKRIGRKAFTLRGGRSKKLTYSIPSSLMRNARRAGRLKVEAFAVTQDAAGNVDTRTKAATLRYGSRRSR